MKVAIAADHAGYEMKEAIKNALGDKYEWLDLGTDSNDSVDYPDFSHAVAKAIKSGEAEKGVLVCGTGIGISIAANRHPEIRAALCSSGTMARLSREHNDANVIVFGSRIMGIEVVLECIDTFMVTEFEGGRHERRVEKINNLE